MDDNKPATRRNVLKATGAVAAVAAVGSAFHLIGKTGETKRIAGQENSSKAATVYVFASDRRAGQSGYAILPG